MREQAHLASDHEAGSSLEPFVDALPGLPDPYQGGAYHGGALAPRFRPENPDRRLTDAGLAELVERIEAFSTYVREIEDDAREHQRVLEQVHARMYARIVEAEERAGAAEARAHDEAARAEAAEERVAMLEQWLLRITQAMMTVDHSAP